MRPVRILCVCGSGTATSAMLAAKLQDVLEERGYQSETDENQNAPLFQLNLVHKRSVCE